MPFLTRGKARSRINRPKVINTARLPTNHKSNTKETISEAVAVVDEQDNVSPILVQEVKEEEQKVTYQEVTYRVPKEERLLDLPLEEEVFGEQEEETENSEPDHNTYNIQPVGEPVSIGAVLKKKKRR